jgi:NADPH:quinone reductase-like Zn-dependent oxidoreductase
MERSMMKTILMPTVGSPDVLQLAEVEKPVPKENQILVKVHAASVNAMDWRRFNMPPFFLRLVGRLRKPKDPRLGTDVAGTVEAVGSSVTEFQPGDEVFGVAPGAFAEHVCNGVSKFAPKPVNVSFEAAEAK